MDGTFGTVGRATSAFVAAVVVFGSAAVAQERGGVPIPEGAYVASVSGKHAMMRAGAGEAYYPFGRLKSGDLILVVDTKGDYARVRTVGPAIDPLFGYVIVPRGETNRLQIAEDGKSGRAAGRLDVLAPNLNSGGTPAESWKSIARLEPGHAVKIREMQETPTDLVFHVTLPADADGWVHKEHLRAATVTETHQWEASMEGRELPKPQVARSKETTGAVAPVLGRTETPVPEVAEPQLDAPEQAPVQTPVQTPEATEDDTLVRRVEMAPGAELPVEQIETPDEPAIARDEQQTPAPGPDATPQLRDDDYESRLEGLEQAYERLRREDIRTAEVTPLRALYIELASDSADETRVSRYCEARAEQLTVWTELQKRRRELDEMRARLDEATTETRAIRLAMERNARYTAIGRLAASSIYDGQRLPRLFRVIDPDSGRTIAYLEVDDREEVLPMLGHLVGIVGTKAYDGTLRLNLIDPERIEVLASQSPEAPGSGS